MSDGLITDNLTAARRMLADCPAWIAEGGWADSTEAADAVSIAVADVPEGGIAEMRPFAVLTPTPGVLTLKLDGQGVKGSYLPRGSVDLHVQVNAEKQDGDDAASSTLRFYALLSGLMLELAERSNTLIDGVGVLRLTQIDLADGPHRTEEDDASELGDAFMATLRLGWGLR